MKLWTRYRLLPDSPEVPSATVVSPRTLCKWGAGFFILPA